MLATTAALALIANAAVLGILSGPHDRYGARMVWLAVLSENVRAIQFYEKEGFGALGRDTFTIGSQSFDFTLLKAGVGPS